MRLEYKLPTRIDLFGKRLKLDLAFDTVLRVYDLLGEENVLDSDKTDVALRLLVKNYRAIRRFPMWKKANIFNTVFQRFIATGKKPLDNQKYMDFRQDADYIYASFLLDYGVDLIEEQGRLDWRKFTAMLSGLSSRTKIRDVIAIRAAEIPAFNEHNGKQIQELIKAKQYYALEVSAEEAEENFRRGLEQLFNMLLAQAKVGGKNGRR